MNRRRAIGLLAISALMVIAYAMYALRFCYLSPSLDFDVNVPDSAQIFIEDWCKENAEDIPVSEIRMNGILHALSDPHNSSNTGYGVYAHNPNLVQIYSDAGDGYFVVFSNESGQWKEVGRGDRSEMFVPQK